MTSLWLWVFPVISITVWLAMLMAMLIHWCVIGKPFYVSEDQHQTIAFISDIGASNIKPLFIAGCCTTTVFLDLSLLAERWIFFQYERREKQSRGDRISGFLSVACAAIGSLGLILLSILDVVHHRTAHESLLILALAGYIISAAFLCWERRQLRRDFHKHYLRSIAFYIKIVFVALEALLIIAFIVCFARYEDPDAVFEWVIAFLFVLYASAFLVDLLPAASQSMESTHTTHREAEIESYTISSAREKQ
ncbi:hypothetical protein N431DRAFT_483247 [Stipitochalara longipes BDJ]|nr:hypothetical protein N431DRAFT_483247 [Stipitochalara longipes BDJ]